MTSNCIFSLLFWAWWCERKHRFSIRGIILWPIPKFIAKKIQNKINKPNQKTKKNQKKQKKQKNKIKKINKPNPIGQNITLPGLGIVNQISFLFFYCLNLLLFIHYLLLNRRLSFFIYIWIISLYILLFIYFNCF